MSNQIDINTLTAEQKRMLRVGYTFKVCPAGKLLAEEPIEKTPEFIAYNMEKINNTFERTVHEMTAGFSQTEIDSWERKIEESKKVIAGETSQFLEALLLEGESVEDMAQKILEKAEQFALGYAQAEKKKREAVADLYAL